MTGGGRARGLVGVGGPTSPLGRPAGLEDTPMALEMTREQAVLIVAKDKARKAKARDARKSRLKLAKDILARAAEAEARKSTVRK